jgi:hypothetical protein
MRHGEDHDDPNTDGVHVLDDDVAAFPRDEPKIGSEAEALVIVGEPKLLAIGAVRRRVSLQARYGAVDTVLA